MRAVAADRAVRGSLVILAGLGLLAFFHYAASVLITILSWILIVLVLDPFVQFLCRRARLGRPGASMIVVFVGIAGLYGLLYLAYISSGQLFFDLPLLIEQVRSAPMVQRIADHDPLLPELYPLPRLLHPRREGTAFPEDPGALSRAPAGNRGGDILRHRADDAAVHPREHLRRRHPHGRHLPGLSPRWTPLLDRARHALRDPEHDPLSGTGPRPPAAPGGGGRLLRKRWQ